MTQSTTELLQAIKGLAEKATQGIWGVDSEYDNDALYSGGGGCGSGFKNFFIGTDIDGKWRTLLDTVNSDHKLIEEDFDEDGKNAWDCIGQANVALIIALQNNLPTIIAALELKERVELQGKAAHDQLKRELARDAEIRENARTSSQ